MSPAFKEIDRARKARLAAGMAIVVLLLAGVFTLGSLKIPFEPSQSVQFVVFFALTIFLFSALLIFGLILTRSLLRLSAEQSAGFLGSRFKTKMVLGAMGISLLPILFLFFVSYSLLNRTLTKWFPRPLEIAVSESQQLLNELGRAEHDRLKQVAVEAAQRNLPAALKFLGETS